MEILTYNDLTQEEKALIDKAEEGLQHAYNPYRKRLVAAAVRTESGKMFTGASFRNQSANVSMCGERAAVINAHSSGHRDIIELASITSSTQGKIDEPAMPCGICRQFLLEFPIITGKDLIILCSNTDKTKIAKTSLSELFPNAYFRQE